MRDFLGHGRGGTWHRPLRCGVGNQVTATVYIKVYFVDKGEPGTADRINFYASTNPAYRHNAELDPNRLVKDVGVISFGNVQIHSDVFAFDSTDMLVPVTP